MSPVVGSISPMIMPIVVVLPAPLPPSNAVTEPAASAKSNGPTTRRPS